METMHISKFKTTCLAVLARERKTGNPILITRFDRPVAQILPLPPDRSGSWLGAMRNRGRIQGNLVSPAAEFGELEVFD